MFICTCAAFSQTASDYIFTSMSGTYNAISGTVSTATGDDGTQTGISIGFTFNFCGTNYTTFCVTTNGQIYFTGAGAYSNDLSSTTYKTRLAPLWDDLYDDASSDIQYQTTGLAPDRILTVQWRQIRWSLSGGTQQNFQIKLYETSNRIEFIYGTMNAPSSGSASIGINDAIGGSGHFISITPGASPTYSTASANNNVNSATYLTSGLTYRFTPPTCFPPSGVTASAVTATTATISWTAATPVPGNGYVYEIRTSGAGGSGSTGLTSSGSTATGVVTAGITNLSPSTVYYVYVRSYCGGSDYSAWTTACSFTTACGSISSFPWSENFDAMGSIGNSVIPSCWKIESSSGTPWSSGNAASIGYNDPASAPNYIYCNYSPGSTDKYLITPGFSLTSGTSYDFKFKYAGDGYSGWTGDVRINTSQTGSGSAVYANFISSSTTSTNSYSEVTCTFVPPSTATYYFMIRINNTTSPYYLGFDDFSVSLSPPPVVFVNATAGTLNGGYTTLKAAFDAINSGVHQGTITIDLGSSDNQTITETSQAVLNKSGVGSANYTSTTVRPGYNNITITGTSGVSLATVKLNEAQNVTFDGRIGSTGTTKNLTIENTSTAKSYGAIWLYGAQNNTITYCTIKSSTTDNYGYGTISLKASSAYGCSYNSIDHCNITRATSLPVNAIASSSTSSTCKNSGNSIKNCNIYDFQMAGIWLGSYSGTLGYNDLWTIENNNIYQTASIDAGSSNVNGVTTYDQYAILIGRKNVSSIDANYESTITSVYNEYGTFIIRNNNIGGNGSGGSWTITGSSSCNLIAPIFVAAANPSIIPGCGYTEIYGNVIKDFNIQTSGFAGICSYNSRVKIGNASNGNTVYNILLNHASASNGGTVAGLYVVSSQNMSNEIVKNQVYNIFAETGNGSATWYYQKVYGIYDFTNSSVSTDQIIKNTITGLSTNKVNYIKGLYVPGIVIQNHISNIKMGSGYELCGLEWSGAASSSISSYRVDNNEIILGLDNTGASTAANQNIYGIKLNSAGYAYYNSVIIRGSSSSNSTCCVRLNSNSTGYVFKNNLMYNERSGGTGNHYCISTAFTNTAYWSSSNNGYILYSGSKAGYCLGQWGASNITSINDWMTTSTETNSVNEISLNKPVSVLFPHLAVDNNLSPNQDHWLCAGIVVAQTNDFDEAPLQRHDPAPTTLGAYEIDCPTVLPIVLIHFAGHYEETGNIQLSWTTGSEINNDYFTIEKSEDGIDFEPLLKVQGAGNSNETHFYTAPDTAPYPGINYYRLRQTDYDGASVVSETIAIETPENTDINVFPNPFTDHIHIKTSTKKAAQTTLLLFDMTGKSVRINTTIVDENTLMITPDDNLADGIYLIRLKNDRECKNFKIVKSGK